MPPDDTHYSHKEPCPACGSRDNLARYTDGGGYCFGCGHHERAERSRPVNPFNKDTGMTDFLRGEPVRLKKRNLDERTCNKFGYWKGKDKRGRTVQIANYRRDGKIVAQKLRYRDKSFKFIGDAKQAGLFGQHLWEPGRKLVITEGEIDCLSVAQVQALKWPTVSLPNGAQGAVRAIKRELEWVEGFQEVVLMFDMDEAGRKAALDVAALLTPGKAKIAHLPAKDPSELLQRGQGEAILNAMWSAQVKRPDAIVTDIPSVGFTGDRLYRPMYIAPDMEPYTGKVMAIDPSGRGGDETGYAVIGLLRGMMHCRRAGATKGGYDDATLETLAHIARAEQVNVILVEANFGDGMFMQMLSGVLTRIYPCSVEEVKHYGTSKENRIIDALEPVLNQHRLVMDATVLKTDQTSEQRYQLFYQLTRITRDRGALRHDDRLEALAMGVKYWADQLARDVSREEDRYQEELLDQQYLDFIQSALGHAPAPANYLEVI